MSNPHYHGGPPPVPPHLVASHGHPYLSPLASAAAGGKSRPQPPPKHSKPTPKPEPEQVELELEQRQLHEEGARSVTFAPAHKQYAMEHPEGIIVL